MATSTKRDMSAPSDYRIEPEEKILATLPNEDMPASFDSKIDLKRYKRRLSFHRLMSFDERLMRAARERRFEYVHQFICHINPNSSHGGCQPVHFSRKKLVLE